MVASVAMTEKKPEDTPKSPGRPLFSNTFDDIQ